MKTEDFLAMKLAVLETLKGELDREIPKRGFGGETSKVLVHVVEGSYDTCLHVKDEGTDPVNGYVLIELKTFNASPSLQNPPVARVKVSPSFIPGYKVRSFQVREDGEGGFKVNWKGLVDTALDCMEQFVLRREQDRNARAWDKAARAAFDAKWPTAGRTDGIELESSDGRQTRFRFTLEGGVWVSFTIDKEGDVKRAKIETRGVRLAYLVDAARCLSQGRK